jgi:hypothetical protein
VLVLSNGCPASELAAIIEALKASSKSITSHSRRNLFWDGYGKLASRANSLPEGAQHCLLLYRCAEGASAGDVEVVALTKRQKGLINSIELMGRKLKAPDAEIGGKSWAMAWSEEEAQVAYDDLLSAEPCIFISPAGVFVSTRFKRVLCKGLGAALKSAKDIEALVAELKPDAPLKSVSFGGNDPPVVNSYNTIVTGPTSVKEMPRGVGHINSTSITEIYEFFTMRRNGALLAEADTVIAQMLTDASKKLVPQVYAGSKKDAAKAYKNAVMKRVFVHESMKKFIDRVRADGAVTLVEIKGETQGTNFGSYGNIVFELFYRIDLDTFC